MEVRAALSCLARSEVFSIFLRPRATYQEVKELSARKKLTWGGGGSLLVLEHAVGDMPFLVEGWREDQISLFEGWEGEGGGSTFLLELLFFSICGEGADRDEGTGRGK